MCKRLAVDLTRHFGRSFIGIGDILTLVDAKHCNVLPIRQRAAHQFQDLIQHVRVELPLNSKPDAHLCMAVAPSAVPTGAKTVPLVGFVRRIQAENA